MPENRIKLFNCAEWEEFVLEWAYYLKTKYQLVERCGGAGDMGCDIIAYPNEGDITIWDNYQCKHYDHPLQPNEIWLEIGKLIYYTYSEEFTYPRNYFFIAPWGAGTSLIKLFKKPDELKQNLINNWDKYCKTKITRTKSISLDDKDLLQYLKEADYSIFGYITSIRLIEEHRSTPYHYVRFGGSLPPRQKISNPPEIPTPTEVTYLQKLFEAYGDHLNREVKGHCDLEDEKELKEHYTDSRIEFYSAESLRNFSRDTLPGGAYEELQDEIHDGIRDAIRCEHNDGYVRVVYAVKTARDLHLTSHALISRLTIRDRGGICHQLANERDNVKWVK